MTFMIVLAAYAGFFFSDLRPVLRSKKRGLIWPCIVLFSAAFVIQALHEFQIDIPSPAPFITGFITAAFNVQ